VLLRIDPDAKPTDRVLMVEGADDQHVIWNLLECHNVYHGVNVVDGKGYDNIHKEPRRRIKAENEKAIGVLVDADNDFESRWASLRNVLIRSGYDGVPMRPLVAGTIIAKQEKPTVGIWIMPNNQSPGMLEDFAQDLLPPQNTLWTRAVAAVDSIPEPERLFKQHVSKARIHTWLAWQENPGHPIGRAIKVVI
jgi:hypothetical protein